MPPPLDDPPVTPLPINVIDKVVLAAAPERAADWRALVNRYSPTFHILEDRKGVTMQAIDGRVEIDSKTMGWIWLLGFAGWRAFVVHGPHFLVRSLTQQPIDAAMRSADQGYASAEAAFETVLYVTRDLAQADSLDEQHGWPEGIPPRQADKTGFDIQQQAAFDLTMIATAYALLHEVKHVLFDQEGGRPSRPEEEIACDRFARDFILDGVASYATSTGEEATEVLAKRAMGIALGAFVVYEFTTPDQRSGGSKYPPIADRLDTLIANLPVGDESLFWGFAATLLIAILIRRNRAILVPDADGRPLCAALIGEVRKLG
jgi:Peptidase U49